MKAEQELKNQNKSLITEDREKFFQLLYYTLTFEIQLKGTYLSRVNDERYWNSKNDYSQLIENFLEFKIDSEDFAD